MAIAGSAAPSWIAEIIDGHLTLDRQTLRQGAVTDVDIALHRLLAGEKIFLSARADVVYRVRATLTLVLGNGDGNS